MTNKSIESSCKHELIFRESLPRNSKWYCRTCFTEIPNVQKADNIK